MASSTKVQRPPFVRDEEGQFNCRKCQMRFDVLDGVAAWEKFSGTPKVTDADKPPKNQHKCPDCGMKFFSGSHSKKKKGIKMSIDLDTYLKQGGDLYKQGTCEICSIPLFGSTRMPRKRCGEHGNF